MSTISHPVMRTLAIIICLLTAELAANKGTIYIVPFYAFYTPEQFFNPNARDECHKSFCQLKAALECMQYRVEMVVPETEIKDPVHIICNNVPCDDRILDKLRAFPAEKKSLYIWEPPLIEARNFDPALQELFGTIYTWYDHLLDGKKIRKFYFPQPRLRMIDDIVDFDQKNFCTMIAGHKSWGGEGELYSERKNIIRFFENNHPEDFDLHGVGWPSEEYRSYRGGVDNKWECYKHYKFCICYENYYQRGSLTEKIFDCFVGGCIPVYWGAPNIDQLIPKNCYILRENFISDKQLYDYLKNMSKQEYEQYQDNIRAYFASGAAAFFSIEHFVAQAINGILEAQTITSNSHI